VGGEPPDDDLIERLLVLAERATSRSTVFQALNALVETGVISELGALSRMDEWKDKHR
jgi:Fe2+ or Zn2+ uptake regulation protein